MLFDLWFDVPHRPTRDADFLGFCPVDSDALAQTVRAICAVQADDGMVFDPQSVTVAAIREDANYGGLRVRLTGTLGNARCKVQLDVGYGDAVTPGPEQATYPVLLEDLPAPSLQVYPRASVVAEKLETIASLGMANSRMKDYYDLHALAREGALNDDVLAEAIAATFTRRGTHLPQQMPLGLTPAFAGDATKQAQWKGFLGKNQLQAPPLADVIEDVARMLTTPLRMAASREKTRTGAPH